MPVMRVSGPSSARTSNSQPCYNTASTLDSMMHHAPPPPNSPWATRLFPPLLHLRRVPTPIPKWILALRLFELLISSAVLAMCIVTLLFDRSAKLTPPLVALLITSALSTVVILPYALCVRWADARLVLCGDGIACLLWGTGFAALGAVQRSDVWVFFGQLKKPVPGVVFPDQLHHVVLAWQTGLAGAYLGAFEFGLFLLTTLCSAYYYHKALVRDAVRPGPMVWPNAVRGGQWAPRVASGVLDSPVSGLWEGEGEKLVVRHAEPGQQVPPGTARSEGGGWGYAPGRVQGVYQRGGGW